MERLNMPTSKTLISTFKIEITGQSGHGSRPHEIKTPAIERAYEVINALNYVNNKWLKIYSGPTTPKIYVTRIQAGSRNTPNQFPGKCTLMLELCTDDSRHKYVLLDLKEAVENASGGTSFDIT